MLTLKNTWPLATLLLFLLTGCNVLPPVKGSKDTINFNLSYDNFSAVQVSNVIKADIIQSDEFKIEITCNSNLQEYLDIEKKNNTLKLKMKKGHSYSNAKIQARIYMPELESVHASGVSNAKIKSFNCNNLVLDCSGASRLTGNVNVKKGLTIDNSGAASIGIDGAAEWADIECSGSSQIDGTLDIDQMLAIDASGASNIDLEGQSRDAEFDFSGASHFNSKSFVISNDSEIQGSGTSHLTYTANGNLDVDLSGASKLSLYGKGRIVHQDVSGVASIRQR